MDIGNAVYLVTDHKTIGAGVPAIICGLYERSARIATEREEATKILEVPLWDLMPVRMYTAAILRGCYSAWESLDRQGKSPATLYEDDLVRELARASLAPKAAEMCARLCWDVDWSAKGSLSAWLKAIRGFYLPRVRSHTATNGLLRRERLEVRTFVRKAFEREGMGD
jgi:hypothetical protein